MLGIDPITLTSLLVLAAGGKASCPAREATKINVVPKTEKVKYDNRQTLKEIQSYKTDTVDPYEFHGQTVTQGFMKGQIQLSQKIVFGQVSNTVFGCVWYDTITIEINIDPTIVIAKELYQDSCMRKAILGHEMLHVNVDRMIVNKYAKTMGNKLLTELKSRGYSAGPFSINRMEEIKSKMQRVITQILELEYKKMGIEREEEQRKVDSLEEYETVGDKCPAFEKRKQQLYADLLK